MGWSNKMKFNFLIKSIPFLSTLLIITFISICNQKEYTKLRILIWDTPSFSLGNYIAISTGTGFIISYFITKNLAKSNQTNQKVSLRFKEDGYRYDDSSETESEINANTFYDNTLIERDLKDPSPTIKASFRVIGRKDISNYDYKNYNNNEQYDGSLEFDRHFDKQHEENEINNQVNSPSSDWNDESYSTW